MKDRIATRTCATEKTALAGGFGDDWPPGLCRLGLHPQYHGVIAAIAEIELVQRRRRWTASEKVRIVAARAGRRESGAGCAVQTL